MKTKRLVIWLVILALSAGVMRVTLAQDATLPPPGDESVVNVDSTDEPLPDIDVPDVLEEDVPTNEDPTVPEEDANVVALVGMAAAVASVVEMVKLGFLRRIATQGGWTAEGYAFACYSLAVWLGLFLAFGAPPEQNIFSVSGWEGWNLTVARIVTGFLLGIGSAAVHAAVDFLGAAKGRPVVINQPTVVETNPHG